MSKVHMWKRYENIFFSDLFFFSVGHWFRILSLHHFKYIRNINHVILVSISTCISIIKNRIKHSFSVIRDFSSSSLKCIFITRISCIDIFNLVESSNICSLFLNSFFNFCISSGLLISEGSSNI